VENGTPGGDGAAMSKAGPRGVLSWTVEIDGGIQGLCSSLTARDLDAAGARHRDLRGNPDGIVRVGRLNEDDAEQLLLWFRRTGAVGDGKLAAADPQGLDGRDPLGRRGDDEMPAAPQHVVVVGRLPDEIVGIPRGQRSQRLLLAAYEAWVFHVVMRLARRLPSASWTIIARTR